MRSPADKLAPDRLESIPRLLRPLLSLPSLCPRWALNRPRSSIQASPFAHLPPSPALYWSWPREQVDQRLPPTELLIYPHPSQRLDHGKQGVDPLPGHDDARDRGVQHYPQ